MVFCFNVVFSFLCISILYNRNYFFNDSLYFDNLWNLDYFFNNCFDEHRNLNDFFYNFLNWNNFFIFQFDLLNLDLDMVDHSFNLNRPVDLYDLFPDKLHLYYLRYLFLKFDYFFNNCWYLNDGLYLLLVRDQCFLFCLNNHGFFDRYMNNFFNLFYLLNFNYLLYNFIDSYNFRNLDNSLNNFLYNFLHFYNFLVDPEDLQNIINIDCIHYLSFDHTNHSFIKFKSNTSLNLYFLQLL